MRKIIIIIICIDLKWSVIIWNDGMLVVQKNHNKNGSSFCYLLHPQYLRYLTSCCEKEKECSCSKAAKEHFTMNQIIILLWLIWLLVSELLLFVCDDFKWDFFYHSLFLWHSIFWTIMLTVLLSCGNSTGSLKKHLLPLFNIFQVIKK